MQSRRDFLEQSLFAAAAAALAGEASRSHAAESAKPVRSPNDRVRLAIIGVNGRGRDHLYEFGRLHDVDIVALVDVDEAIGKPAAERLKKKTNKEVTFYRDLRKMLENKNIDAVSIATPNHWHSLAAIWAHAGRQGRVRRKAGEP